MLGQIGQNTWAYHAGNMVTTRPASTWGTSITPGNNSYGSYASLLSSLTYDCYFVKVQILAGATSNQARDLIVTIGIDPAGGTSYQTWIPDLLGSNASAGNIIGGGFLYYFPLYAPAGSQIAAKASVNNATVGTVRVMIQLFGQPSRPDAIWCGSSVEAVGIVSGSSRGTTVTPGTTSDGSWTSLGTTTQRCLFWQLGAGLNDAAMAGDVSFTCDLSTGDGTNQSPIITDVLMGTTALEQMALANSPEGWRDVPAGATIYGRMQGSGTAESNHSLAAYGVRS